MGEKRIIESLFGPTSRLVCTVLFAGLDLSSRLRPEARLTRGQGHLDCGMPIITQRGADSRQWAAQNAEFGMALHIAWSSESMVREELVKS